MFEPLNTEEAWTPYLGLLEDLKARLESKPWFLDGWKAQCRYVSAGNRVIFLLTKERWCDEAIYFKARLTNADLRKGLVRVGLHVETSISRHGINRITFDRALLDGIGEQIQSWNGYVLKPLHYQKPFHIWIPFTKASLVSALETEFVRIQQFDSAIDQAILASKA